MKNYLGIDYGTKRVGLAYSINGIIATLDPLTNDRNLIPNLRKIIDKYQISKIYVGLSSGPFVALTHRFVGQLRRMLQLSVETVEEAVSTIEADEIFKKNRKKKKDYHQRIDSVSAAVILSRVIIN